jgi:rhodanese-related sulfurtransferase
LDLAPELILAFVLVGLFLALPIVSRKLYGPVTYVLPSELEKRLGDGERLLVFDIRSAGNYAKGHLAGAVNASRRELPDRLTRLRVGDVDTTPGPVVLVCQSDLRAIAAARMLEKLGHENVAVMKGGMHGWKRARLPQVSGS